MTASRLAGQLLWFLVIYLVAVATDPADAQAQHGVRLAGAGRAGGGGRGRGRRCASAAAWTSPVSPTSCWSGWRCTSSASCTPTAGWAAPGSWRSAGYGLAAALVAFGPYPLSMIGMPGAAVSNMAPPTVALLAVGVGQIGLALALRRWIVSFAGWPGVSRVLGWAGGRMMTLYLWHMSALFVIVSMVVVGLGVSTPEPGTSAWVSGWPHWLLMLALAMWPLLRGLATVRDAPRRAAVHRGDGQGRRGHRAGGTGPAHAHRDRLRPGDGSPARGGRDRGGPGAHRSVPSPLAHLAADVPRPRPASDHRPRGTFDGSGTPEPTPRAPQSPFSSCLYRKQWS